MLPYTKNEAMCFRKVPYLSEHHVLEAADRARERDGSRLWHYQCPYCLRWHLTKRLQPGWHPFPPPKLGTYTIRDPAGKVIDGAIFIERWSGGTLYCIAGNTTIGRADRMAQKGYEWFHPSSPTSDAL